LSRLADVNVGGTCGYGWIGPDGNGAYTSWKDFVVAFHAEDQTGTFWENWHVLYRTSCLRITGIIDGNCMYGDFLVDLAILDRHMPRSSVIQTYQDYQAKAGKVIPNFKERLLGAYYFKGLDGLRFYAKMGWKDAYQGTRQFLFKPGSSDTVRSLPGGAVEGNESLELAAPVGLNGGNQLSKRYRPLDGRLNLD